MDIEFKTHHVSINVLNIDESLDFYYLLGFNKVYEYTDDDVLIYHLKNNDFIIELFHYKNNKNVQYQPKLLEKHSNFIGCEHFSFSVNNINQAFEVLDKYREDGTTVTLGRTGIKYFFVTDPNGVRIEIVEDNRVLEAIV